ncbi:MAG: helix-turn-helix domain-containing protein [Mediterranea sp.]|jgi:predicted DNA-binding transcriptional regulator AlpA|nr:helix-turn-helix domain-containing protein [Mediterranea sp.]
MSIKDIIDSPKMAITVTTSDLKEMVRYFLDEAHKQFEQELLSAQKGEVYLITKEVVATLKVDRTTLWRWANTGYLVPIELGGKRRYRSSDIEKLMKGGEL